MDRFSTINPGIQYNTYGNWLTVTVNSLCLNLPLYTLLLNAMDTPALLPPWRKGFPPGFVSDIPP